MVFAASSLLLSWLLLVANFDCVWNELKTQGAEYSCEDFSESFDVGKPTFQLTFNLGRTFCGQPHERTWKKEAFAPCPLAFTLAGEFILSLVLESTSLKTCWDSQSCGLDNSVFFHFLLVNSQCWTSGITAL